MEKPNGTKVAALFLVIVLAVVFLSSLSNRLMGGKKEEMKEQKPLSITESMTIEEFGKVNGLSKEVLKEVFGITVKEDLQKTIGADGIPKEEVLSKVTKEGAIHEEFESKNWVLIPIKFALWIGFLIMVFVYMRKGLDYTEDSENFLPCRSRGFRGHPWLRSKPHGYREGCCCSFGDERGHFPSPHDCSHPLPCYGFSRQQIYLFLGMPVRHSSGYYFSIKP